MPRSIIGIALSLKRGSFLSDTTENYKLVAAKNESILSSGPVRSFCFVCTYEAMHSGGIQII